MITRLWVSAVFGLARSSQLGTRGSLQFVLFHQMAERAVGNSQQVGGTSLHSTRMVERALQQRTFYARDISFHSNSTGQYRAIFDSRSGASRSRCGGARFGPF